MVAVLPDPGRVHTFDASRCFRRGISTVTATRSSVSVIVPTRNEAGNVEMLASRVADALAARCQYEIIFVDDSDDQTPTRIQSLKGRLPVELLHRTPVERQGGLGGAVRAGFAMASGEVFVVMDADLQHPPEFTPKLVTAVQLRLADVVIASRFMPGGSASGLSGWTRHLVTYVTRQAAYFAAPRSRGIRDPLSGFFAVRSEVVSATEIRSEGFKILLDVLTQGSWSTALEIPFDFGQRHSGTSKADLREGLRFGRQLVRSRLKRSLSPPVQVADPAGSADETRETAAQWQGHLLVSEGNVGAAPPRQTHKGDRRAS